MKKNLLSKVIETTLVFVISLTPSIAQSLGSAPDGAPRKINLAVVAIRNNEGVTKGETDLISDRLVMELFNTNKVNIMERSQMQDILKEQGFQQSGACTDQSCLVEMGQVLGVEQIVYGSMGKLGNMFMINLRIIDVQTAKIKQVVSKDIKGNIEDVVVYLSQIAAQLVGPPTPGEPQPQKLEEKPQPSEPKIVAQTPLEQPVVDSAQPKPQQPPEETDVRASRNHNRSGIRLGLVLTPGDAIIGNNATDPTGYYLSSLKPAYKNPYIKFVIAAGPVLGIDIGAGAILGHEKFTYTDGFYGPTNTIDDEYVIPGIYMGLNFVKRWYPIKLNLGFLFDLNLMLNTYTDDYHSLEAFGVGLGLGYGGRAGIELMAGKNVGFGCDFVYHYLKFDYEQTTTISGVDHSYSRSFQLAPIAINIALNFYY